MVDKKTITISALAAIVGALVMLGGVKLTDDDVYYSEDKNMVKQCSRLSKYYGLPNGKCWGTDGVNKLSRTGWIKVVDDIELKPYTSSTGDWECRHGGCIPI